MVTRQLEILPKKLEDSCYPLLQTDKSLKLDSIHRKDFILLLIVFICNKVLELNQVLIHLICYC